MVLVPRIAFATLGCKTNQAETIRLVSQLAWDLAVVPFDEPADIYVVNTCTVTGEADRQSRKMVRRAHRANPEASIVVTGCAVEQAQTEIGAMPGVRLVATNARKDAIAAAIAAWHGLALGDLSPVPPGDSTAANHTHARAWLKVSEGCDNSCAFCVIPRVRGANTSRPAGELVTEAAALARSGYREIVLTGINIGSYGQDGRSELVSSAVGAARGATLAPLVRRLIDQVPEIGRWRISSIEPIAFPEDLIAIYAHPKVCPHAHLCLQSGSDRVLARMRRRYNSSMYAERVAELRAARPGIAVTTDVLVGFPGETAEDFEQTLTFMRRIGFAGVHLFPFSPREGTPAADLDGALGPGTVAERMERAQEVVRELEQAFLDRWVGQEVEALVERVRGTHATATTPHHLKVRLPGQGLRPNDLVRARVEAIEGGRAIAIPCASGSTRTGLSVSMEPSW